MNNPDPAASSDGGLRTAFPATLLLALAALAAVAPLPTDAYLPAFGQMADHLGVSASSVQLTMTTFLVGIALGQLGCLASLGLGGRLLGLGLLGAPGGLDGANGLLVRERDPGLAGGHDLADLGDLNGLGAAEVRDPA